MEIANRLARGQLLHGFEALAAFANVGDTPEDLQRFRLQWPEFFPTDPVSERPGFQSVSDWLYFFGETWAKEFADFKAVLKPPVIWYRDCVRAVWARNDPTGANLCALLGFEREAHEMGFVNPVCIIRPMALPGHPQPFAPDKQVLPRGTPVVNGVSGEITWKFGCYLQQAVYELVRNRWRAKICPVCGGYYVADKTAQKFCSTRCSGDMKRQRALEWWNRDGQESRAKKRRKSRGRTKQ